jgi:hypothetical protein
VVVGAVASFAEGEVAACVGGLARAGRGRRGSRIERVPNLSARDNQRLARACDDGLSSGPRVGD